MPVNFSNSSNARPPASPGFGNTSKPPFNPIPIIILVLIIAGAGYAYQSLGGASGLQKLGDGVSSAINEVNSSFDSTGKAVSADQNLTEKLNAYADLLNYVSDNVRSSYDRYGQWVDLNAGPTGQERNVYGLYQLNDHARYFDAAQVAYDAQPQIDLDQDFPAFKDAYLKLKPLLDQAYAYYDQDDYKDDDFAKGKALHNDLVAAFKAFNAANAKLSADYEVVDIAQRQKEIGQYLSDNRIVAYDSASTLDFAQQMYISLREQLESNGNDAGKLNADELKVNIDKFEVLLTTLKADQSKQDEVKREYGITGESLFSTFVGESSDFLKSAKSLYRGIRDKNLPKRDVFANSTAGTPENLIATYNDLVDSFNFMNRF